MIFSTILTTKCLTEMLGFDAVSGTLFAFPADAPTPNKCLSLVQNPDSAPSQLNALISKLHATSCLFP